MSVEIIANLFLCYYIIYYYFTEKSQVQHCPSVVQNQVQSVRMTFGAATQTQRAVHHQFLERTNLVLTIVFL